MVPKGSTNVCFVALIQIPAYTLQEQRFGLVYHVVHLLNAHLSLVLIAPTHRGMARLS